MGDTTDTSPTTTPAVDPWRLLYRAYRHGAGLHVDTVEAAPGRRTRRTRRYSTADLTVQVTVTTIR